MDATDTILTLVSNIAIAVALYFVILKYRYPLTQVYGINAALAFLSLFLGTFVSQSRERGRGRRERVSVEETPSMLITLLLFLTSTLIFALPFFRFSILQSLGIAGTGAIAAFVGWLVANAI